MQARHLLESRIQHSATVQQIIETFDLLSSWQMNASVLQAALLMPLMRQDLMSERELVDTFGLEVVQITKLATRLIFYDATTEVQKNPSVKAAHVEKLRRLFVYAYSDINAVLVCVAHRIALASQVPRLNEAEQQTWANATLGVFVPLMEMLGMGQYRDDIGSLSLGMVNPTLYDQLAKHVLSYYKHHEMLFGSIRHTLVQLLEDQHIHGAEVRLYESSPAWLYRSMEHARQMGKLKHLSDMGLLRVDLLLKTERDCYAALGTIHNTWRPARHHQGVGSEERFHDSIALPHYNGYRALVTTVLVPEFNDLDGSNVRPVEFRIRTYEMERVNRYGITTGLAVKNAWWTNKLLKLVINPRDTGHLKDEIYVFTPTGEVVYPLHRGSTVIDFAFKVHSALGPYARRFWVNGRPVSLERELRPRDLVEIEYDTHFPSLKPEWEDFAHTSTAKNHIRRFLKQQAPQPHRGRKLIDDVLEREMSIYEIRFPEDKIELTLNKIARDLDCPTLETLYVKVLNGELAPDEIVANMIEDELVDHITLADTNERPKCPIRIARTWMQEKEARKWDKSVRVMPGVEIVGHVVGKGDKVRLVVHRRDSPIAPSGNDAVPLNWHGMKDLREAAEIHVIAPPRSYVVGMVLNAIYSVGKETESQSLTIHRFDADMQDTSLHVNMVVDAPSFDAIHKLQNTLKVIQRSGYITDFKIWHLFPGQKMLLASKLDKRQQNPYTLRQIRDRNMFFGRDEEINRIIETINDDMNFLILYGQKRIGKTSLLYQLAENLLPHACNVLPVLFDAHSLAPFDAVPFLYGLVEAANEVLPRVLKRAESRKGLRLRERDLARDPYVAFAAWVKEVERRLQGMRLLFMVDEFTTAEEQFQKGQLDDNFFDGMQYLAGNRHIGFLLCVHDHVYKRTSRTYPLLQRGQPFFLGSLDRKSAARLIQQPLERIYKFDDALVEQILDLTNCHPFFIHAICQEITHSLSQSEHDHVTEEDLQHAISHVIRTGDHYFNHFYSRIDDHAFATLKIIAYTAETPQNWVSSDRIRQEMEHHKYESDSWKVSLSISNLLNADILDVKQNPQGQALYRIQIGLFQMWLRQITTQPFVRRDLQRDETR